MARTRKPNQEASLKVVPVPSKPKEVLVTPKLRAELTVKETPAPSNAEQALAEFMETARRRYTEARDADRPDRELAELDVDFVSNQNQWEPAIREARNMVGMP